MIKLLKKNKEATMIQYSQLKTLTTLADEGSFSLAAKVLNITQPAVSLQIKAIEQNTGLKIFERIGGTIVLTEDGQVIYDHAMIILEQYQNLNDFIETSKNMKSRSLKMIVSTVPGDYILPAYLSEFKKMYPDIITKVQIEDSQKVIHQVLNGAYDFGIIGHKASHRDIDSKFLWQEHLKLIKGAHTPFKYNSLKQTLTLPLVLRERGSGTREAITDFFKDQGINLQESNTMITLGSTQSIINAVSEGLGISWVSEHAIQDALKLNKIETADAPYDIERNFYLITRKKKKISPLSENFIQFIEAIALK